MAALLEEEGCSHQIAVDSAGTSAHHIGEPADRRSRGCAAGRGVELPSISRQFVVSDFEQFDWVLAMDGDNQQALHALAPNAEARQKIHLLRSFDPDAPRHAEVPDPYYGGPGGFDEVFDLCQAACRGLLDQLRLQHPHIHR